MLRVRHPIVDDEADALAEDHDHQSQRVRGVEHVRAERREGDLKGEGEAWVADGAAEDPLPLVEQVEVNDGRDLERGGEGEREGKGGVEGGRIWGSRMVCLTPDTEMRISSGQAMGIGVPYKGVLKYALPLTISSFWIKDQRSPLGISRHRPPTSRPMVVRKAASKKLAPRSAPSTAASNRWCCAVSHVL